MMDEKTEGLSRIGTVVLDRFRLDRQIGKGGFAFAYAAHDLKDEGPAVVKIAKKTLIFGTRGAELRRRFEAEGRAAARLVHPNLPLILATGHTPDGIPAIAMELIEGELLESRLVGARGLDREEWETCFGQLIDALARIHGVGVIHRDITPRNIIWSAHADGRPRPVLLDFGIAKIGDVSLGTHGAMGTPGFMAPEQILGQATTRSDVFALGACLWWASTGRPFLAQFQSIEDLFGYQMGERSVPDPREVDPQMPAELAELISSTLLSAQEDRIGSQELRDRWPGVVASTRGRWNPKPPGAAMIEPDLEGFGAPEVQTLMQRPPEHRAAEVVIVSDDPVLLRLVAAQLRGLGRDVLVSPNPDITGVRRHLPNAVFIVSTELRGVDGYDIGEQLRKRHPKVRVYLISRHDEGARWLKTSAHDFFILPADLDRLTDVVQTAFADRFRVSGSGPPIPVNRATIDGLVHRSSAPEVADRIEQFVSSLPQQIATVARSLEEANDRHAQQACSWLTRQASNIGADRLADLAQVIHALIGEGDHPTARRLLRDVQAEHARVHQALLLARGQLLGLSED
jgi:CheY-like chemotaxis protein